LNLFPGGFFTGETFSCDTGNTHALGAGQPTRDSDENSHIILLYTEWTHTGTSQAAAAVSSNNIQTDCRHGHWSAE